jgi:hypothetical protein
MRVKAEARPSETRQGRPAAIAVDAKQKASSSQPRSMARINPNQNAK